MKVVFAGTPEFAVPSLKSLIDTGMDVRLVLAQPDRPSGRGRAIAPGPVRMAAAHAGLPVRQPDRIRDAVGDIAAADPDVMVVVAFGMLLPETVLELPRLGCINVHASLLPRWRGAAPIARAIEAGDVETGVTLIRMDTGLDTGPVLARRGLGIEPSDTAGTLGSRLSVLGGELLRDSLEPLADGDLVEHPQDQASACYAPKITTAESIVDWSAPASLIERRIRAFHPRPVARTWHSGQELRIHRARIAPGNGDWPAGTVVRADREGIVVQTGCERIAVTTLQRSGGRPLDAAAFINGYPLKAGDRFTSSI